jgi:DNA anti-recombination protein RmuC
MEALRKSWTDDRLDEFSRRVDERFDQVDKRFDQVDKRFDKVDERFEKVDKDIREVRAEMKAGFDRVADELRSLHRMLIWFSGTLSVSLIGLLGALVIAQS